MLASRATLYPVRLRRREGRRNTWLFGLQAGVTSPLLFGLCAGQGSVKGQVKRVMLAVFSPDTQNLAYHIKLGPTSWILR